jgi:hypothetical protein
VEVLGRTGIEYREGEMTMFVDSEVLAIPAIAVFKESIRAWKPPFDNEPLSQRQKDQILANICAAIGFRNEIVYV